VGFPIVEIYEDKMSQGIKLLLPKGSLNKPGRGDTCGLLKQSGYDMDGYEPGKESDKRMDVRNDPEIEVMLARPQSMPNELLLGFADLAICGTDWVVEETNGEGIERIADLGYGKTRIVFAVSQEAGYHGLESFLEDNPKVICFAEYVNTAARAIAATEAYKARFGDRGPMKIFRGNVFGDNQDVKVIMSDGVTEGYIAKGANLVLDNTQTGSTLREYGLKVLEQIADSSAGLYASSEAMKDSWKRQKAEEIADQLLGAVEARKKDYVVFNVPKTRLGVVIDYITKERLFAEEPTLSEGRDYCQVSVLVPKARWPEISRDLRKIGATSIMRYQPQQLMGSSTKG
jgi:ATP phosphoribosyltransferase-like protein